MLTSLLLMVFLAAGCNPTEAQVPPTCSLALTLEPQSGAVGDEITALGGPVSDDWDTVVRVGGVDAAVLSVSRADCDACDLCREAASCDACSLCEDCVTSCQSCVEATRFELPDVPAGAAEVLILNQYGSSTGLSLEVQ